MGVRAARPSPLTVRTERGGAPPLAARTIHAWILSSSCWSRARPSSTSPGTSCSRPPGDPLRAAAVGMSTAAAVICPLALVIWLATGQPTVPAETLVLSVVSGALEALYFAFLAAAYRRGDLSLVYPLARGTAPLLAVAIGVFLLHERLGILGFMGVARLADRPPLPPAAVAIPHGGRPGQRRRGGLRAPDRDHDRLLLGGRSGRRPRNDTVDLCRPDLAERDDLPRGLRLGVRAPASRRRGCG